MLQLKRITEEFSMPQTYTRKKAQLCVLFRREQSVIICLLCWKPALHFSLATGSPILCLVLQVVYSALFDNIIIRNKQQGACSPLVLPFFSPHPCGGGGEGGREIFFHYCLKSILAWMPHNQRDAEVDKDPLHVI